MSKSDSQCCECVEEMAEQLKKFKGDIVFVYEKNAIILGRITDVIDKSVLVLENVQKISFFGNSSLTANFLILYVSICEITEFSPPEPAFNNTLLNNLNQLKAIKLL
ncbi:hypothetical protein J7I80_21225 [Bacillus sp. ISL-41]|uniref:hypothetical protein n=1 Tax=Bacillus sp. ISL-41 TaxID=2819127 RepID=UPI001BE6076B|nr:hypothetical protein [Bacillus sp. ISL-41]MBT2644744.1 hypothetical protein [Bacillus sp. ISL-41]